MREAHRSHRGTGGRAGSRECSARRYADDGVVGVAALVVMATVVPMPASTTSPAVRLAASTACTGTTEMRCALLMGGTTGPTLNDADVEGIMSRFIAPTHPDQTIKPSR